MTYYCYLIVSQNRTYIGITNNLDQRIRKHNGEIKGGAKSTAMSVNWKYHTIIGQFTNNSKAARFEWYWKHYKNTNNKWVRTKSGIRNKMMRLIELLLDNEWDTVKIAPVLHTQH